MSDASELASAYIAIRADTSRLPRDLDDIKGLLLSQIQGLHGVVAGALGTLFAAGMALGTGHMVQAAVDKEDADKRLEAVVRATGQAAGFTAEQLIEMADALEKVTRYEAETTSAAMAMLLTFKDIKGDNFAAAIEMSMNMAAIGFGSVESAAMMLGKALQDPERGLTALRRANVSFTETEQETIKSMVAMGKTAEAQSMILQSMADQGLAGLAREMAGTFGGALSQMRIRLGDVTEAIGRLLMPALRPIVAVVTEISVAIASRESLFTGWAETIGAAVGTVLEGMRGVGQSLAGVFAAALGDARPLGEAVGSAFESAVRSIRSALDWLAGFIERNREAIAAVLQFAGSVGVLAAGFLAAGPIIRGALAGVQLLLGGLLSPLGLIAAGAAGLALAASHFGVTWESVLQAVGGALARLGVTWELVRSLAEMAASAFEGVAGAVRPAVAWLTDFLERNREVVASVLQFVAPVAALAAALVAVGPAVGVVASAVGAVGTAVGVVTGLLGGLAVPLGLAAAGFAGVNLLADYFGVTWAEVLGTVTALLTDFGGTWAVLQSSFVAHAAAAWDAIVSAAAAAWDGLKGGLVALGSFAVSSFSEAWGAVKSVVVDLMVETKDAVLALVLGAFGGVGATARSALTDLPSVILGAGELALAAFTGYMRAVKTVVVDGVTAAASVLASVAGYAVEPLAPAWEFVKSTVVSGMEVARDAVTGAFGAIKSVVSGVFDTIVSVAGSAWDFVASGFQMVGAQAVAAFEVLQSLTWEDVLQTAVVAVQNLGLTWEITTTFIALKAVEMADAFTDAFYGMLAVAGGAWEAIKAGADATWENFKAGLAVLKEIVVAQFEGIWKGFQAIFKGENPIAAFEASIREGLQRAANVGGGRDAGKEMGEAFERGFGDALSGLNVGDSAVAKELRKELDDLTKRFNQLKQQAGAPSMPAGPGFVGPPTAAQQRDMFVGPPTAAQQKIMEEGPPTAERQRVLEAQRRAASAEGDGKASKVEFKFHGTEEYAKAIQESIKGGESKQDQQLATAKAGVAEAKKTNEKLDKLVDRAFAPPLVFNPSLQGGPARFGP